MALLMNYHGLTYKWYYGNMVNVYDNGIAVDAFSLGTFANGNSYSEFVAGVVKWADYIGDAAYYSSENAF